MELGLPRRDALTAPVTQADTGREGGRGETDRKMETPGKLLLIAWQNEKQTDRQTDS